MPFRDRDIARTHRGLSLKDDQKGSIVLYGPAKTAFQNY